MQTSSDRSVEDPLITLARAMGGSRFGQLCWALVVALFFAGLAAAAWHFRDFAAMVVTLGLIGYGLERVWRLLPIPLGTRARWKEAAQDHWPWSGRFFRPSTLIYMGFIMLMLQLWKMDLHHGPNAHDWHELNNDLFTMVIGFIGLIYRRFFKSAPKETTV